MLLYAHLLPLPTQDVRYESRVPGRLRLRVAPEQLETLQFDHSSNGSNGGAPPEDPTLCGCSTATLSVHGGERAGRPRVYDSLTTPIVQVTCRYTCMELNASSASARLLGHEQPALKSARACTIPQTNVSRVADMYACWCRRPLRTRSETQRS